MAYAPAPFRTAMVLDAPLRATLREASAEKITLARFRRLGNRCWSNAQV